MAIVLVMGASAGIGLETVRRALAEGHEVRAFARTADRMDLRHDGLTRIAADALDAGEVAKAVQGADIVIQSLGMGPSLRPVTFFSAATRILVEAMKSAGVRRLVAVTGLGAGDSRGKGGLLYDFVFFPLFLKRIYDDKDVQEMIIRTSGLEWTIVRPGLLTNAAASGRYQVLTDPARWRAGSIARADVADFLVRQIGDRAHIGRTPLLIG